MSKMNYAAGLGLALAATALPIAAAAENRIDRIRPDAPELAAFGTHPIGVQTLQFTNPDQNDILNTTDEAQPLYDRDLTVEVWYPAAAGTEAGGSYRAFLRDGKTEVTLQGRAARDAHFRNPGDDRRQAARGRGQGLPLDLFGHKFGR